VAAPPEEAAPPQAARPAFAPPRDAPRPRHHADPPLTEPLAALGRGVAVGGAHAGTWIGPALAALTVSDTAAAAQLAVELAPVQALAIGLEFDADIVLLGLGAWRVAAGPEGAASASLSDLRPRGDVDFRLTTEPAAFVEFVTGHRRVRGRPKIRIQGGRRRAKRLRDLGGAPAGLGDAFRAGATLDVELVWAAVATAIEPSWTAGARFTVAYEPLQAPPFYVHVDDGGPVTVDDDAGPEPPAATVRGSQHALLALLVGATPADGDKASIAGDLAALQALDRWAARAQDPATAAG
jgi:hypothetical protein